MRNLLLNDAGFAVELVRENVVSVTREKSEVLDADPAKVIEAVRVALARGQASYDYKLTCESDDHLEFRAVIRPRSWLMLSTRLLIQIHPEASQTRIVARTISQAFIMGDIFDYYRGYLRDVLVTIRGLLGNPNYNPVGPIRGGDMVQLPAFPIASLAFRHFRLRMYRWWSR